MEYFGLFCINSCVLKNRKQEKCSQTSIQSSCPTMHLAEYCKENFIVKEEKKHLTSHLNNEIKIIEKNTLKKMCS